MTTQIQIRRDTAANWNNVDPVLAEGEIGMDMTVNAFKVGDGVSAWSAIDYAGTDISLDDYYTKVEADDAFQPKGDYLTEFVEEDPTVPDHVKGITQDDIDGWNAGGGSGGTGSSVHIGENPPADPQEGQQWMEVPASGDATMWIYDSGNGGQWLQQPGGKDGAPGKDGADAVWSEVTPDGDIYYNKGSVGIGTDSPKLKTQINDGVDKNLGFRASTNLTDGMTIVSMNDSGSLTQPLEFFATSMSFRAISTEALTIDSTGDATFSGTVNFGEGKGAIRYATTVLGANGVAFENTSAGSGVILSNNGQQFDPTSTGEVNLGNPDRQWKDAHFSGTVYANGSPLTRATDLIKTLTTLRNATKDETTLEGLRDAIGNAIGGLIEEFENQIATMPAEVEE